jgi:N-acetylmuramoyl-L-alanine amidase
LTVLLLLAATGCSVFEPSRPPLLDPDLGYVADKSQESKMPVTNQAVVALEPGVPLHSEAPQYADSWVSLGKWARQQGFKGVERVALAPQPISSPATNRYRWNNLDLKGVSVIAPLPAFMLDTGHGQLLIQAETRQAYWNGVAVFLGFQPRIVQGELLVRDVDLENTIGPLFDLPTETETPASKVIAIDPGHGGKDFGCVSVVKPHVEKMLTLDLAQRLAAKLEKRGWKVVLTRTNDVEMSALERIRVAERAQANLFVSLHFNYSAEDAKVDGVEAECLAPVGVPASHLTQKSDNPLETLPNNKFDVESFWYAFRCEQALVGQVGATGQGVKRVRASEILSNQERPAILILGGYLSNPQEAEMIANPDYRERLADALVKGLVNFE